MKYLFMVPFLIPIPSLAQSLSENGGVPFGSDCTYPASERIADVSGPTGVTFEVAADGSINGVIVAFPSGNKKLDDAAASCVSGWKISSTTDAKWVHSVTTKRILVKWEIPLDGSKPIVGHAVLGWPHTCGQYYPAAEAKAGIGGKVVLSFNIKTDGHVSEVRVAQSSGNRNLDDAAVQCAKTWRYLPAEEKGSPVEVPWKAELNWAIPSASDSSAPPK